MQVNEQQFAKEIAKYGYFSTQEHATLLDVAKRCARISGLPMASAVGVVGAKAGSVTVPGVGAVPGWVAGVLAGLITGTGMCLSVQYGLKEELQKLLRF